MAAVDFEKNRAEYVGHLEVLVKNLQDQLQALKEQERWIPQVGSELIADEEKARITLAFGGKRQTASFSYDYLRDQSLTDATTGILEMAFKDFILTQLRPALEPEVDRLQKGAKHIVKAGQW